MTCARGPRGARATCGHRRFEDCPHCLQPPYPPYAATQGGDEHLGVWRVNSGRLTADCDATSATSALLPGVTAALSSGRLGGRHVSSTGDLGSAIRRGAQASLAFPAAAGREHQSPARRPSPVQALLGSCGRAGTRVLHLGARAAAVVVLAWASVIGPMAAPAPAAGSGSVEARPVAEAWYRTAPVCALPSGCPTGESVPNPYPPDTLHVGVRLGMEEARTYLLLDLKTLPPGTKPAGGELRLPLAADAGTMSPEAAKLQACPVKVSIQEVQGSFEPPPEVDCKAATSLAEFVPAAGASTAALIIDLAGLAGAWRSGAVPGAIALLPADAPAPVDNWHTAFNDRQRAGDPSSSITAAVSYLSDAADTAEAPPPPVNAPVESASPDLAAPALAGADALGFPAIGPPDVAPPATAPAPVPAPTVAAAAPVAVPVAVVVPGPYKYPGLFVLPIVIATFACWVGRALTSDLGDDAPRR